jgi:ElaB/YqjD/DUF883 family membrane-anchored ribosome-binding protein
LVFGPIVRAIGWHALSENPGNDLVRRTVMATAKRKPRRSDVSAAAETLQDDFQTLRDDLGTLAEEVTTLIGKTGDRALEDVKDRIGRVRANLEDVVGDASDRGRDALRDVSERVEEHIRERPMTVIALAVGLGFVFGATWRR